MNPNVRFKKMLASEIEAVIIHHSATRPSQDIGAAEIDSWHRGRGWLAIGYHFVIRRDGSIEPGRYIDQVGAHAGPEWNDRSIGICMVGGLGEDGTTVEDNFTDNQYRSLRALLKAIGRDLPLKLHKDVSNTECSMVNLSRTK